MKKILTFFLVMIILPISANDKFAGVDKCNSDLNNIVSELLKLQLCNNGDYMRNNAEKYCEGVEILDQDSLNQSQLVEEKCPVLKEMKSLDGCLIQTDSGIKFIFSYESTVKNLCSN